MNQILPLDCDLHAKVERFFIKKIKKPITFLF